MKNNNEKVIEIISRDNYEIEIVKQDNLKKDKTKLYKTIAKLLYEDAVEKKK